jgi:hypothetical protein
MRTMIFSNQSPLTTHGSSTFVRHSRWRFRLTVAGLMVAVIAIGLVALTMVKREIQNLVAANLTAMVATAQHVVDDYLENRTAMMASLAKREPVREQVPALLRGEPQALTSVRALCDGLPASLKIPWWAVVDQHGKILVSPLPEQTGQSLPSEALAGLAAAAQGTPTTTPPVLVDGLKSPCFLGFASLSQTQPAYFVMATEVLGDFSHLLATDVGRTGEVYAFDHQGRMLTESRFTAELRGTVLPADATTSIFTLELRDSSQAAAGALRSNLPFTLPVRESLAGRNGIEMDGYLDYRRQPVLAAWRWLPQRGLGVTIKIDRSEAYQALTRLTWLFLVLLGLILIAGVAVAFSRLANERLARRASQAEKTAEALGQYQLERKIGEGGMGAVYIATHRLLRRKTAVKMITGRVDAETVAKFEREVRLCSQLSHPNTIAIYDFGRTPEGIFYYAMECLEGMDLQVMVERHGPLPPGRVIHLLTQACGSLAEAHRAQMLHRDIKPANIFITERGDIPDFVKVLDFGLVKKLGGNTGSTLSQADVISGTPGYMAPEVITQSAGIDGRADVYALALVGFYLLTGRDAFGGGAVMEVLLAHVKQPPPLPSSLAPVPADLEEVILRCLAKDPQQRPVDAEAFAAELSACRDARTWTVTDARAWWAKHAQTTPETEATAKESPGPVLSDVRLTSCDLSQL